MERENRFSFKKKGRKKISLFNYFYFVLLNKLYEVLTFNFHVVLNLAIKKHLAFFFFSTFLL